MRLSCAGIAGVCLRVPSARDRPGDGERSLAVLELLAVTAEAKKLRRGVCAGGGRGVLTRLGAGLSVRMDNVRVGGSTQRESRYRVMKRYLDPWSR